MATTHLLTGIADLGVQVFDVDDMMNLRQSRDAVGGRSVITGNVEPVEVVLKSKRREAVSCQSVGMRKTFRKPDLALP